MTALGQAFNWHLDIFWTLAIPALVVAYIWATRQEDCRPTRRQRRFFILGVVALLIACMWPLGDLAAHWSLLALVLQRLLLTLAIPPLLVTGTPRPIIGRLTRPLLSPDESEREGYVPNVVYSCGSMIHAGLLILPYAMSDTASSFATVPLVDLLKAMESIH